MKIALWLSIVLSTVISTTAMAAPEPRETLREKLAAMDTLTGDFEQEVYEEGALVETFTGQFALRRPDHLYWETAEPEASVLVADGETLSYYNPFVEQVTLYQQQDMVASNPLLRLLATAEDADTSSDDSDELKITREENVFAVWDTAGEPDVPELKLTFDDEARLSKLVLNDGMGQQSRFYLSAVTMNDPVADDKFHFETPAGVEVDDQR